MLDVALQISVCIYSVLPAQKSNRDAKGNRGKERDSRKEIAGER